MLGTDFPFIHPFIHSFIDSASFDDFNDLMIIATGTGSRRIFDLQFVTVLFAQEHPNWRNVVLFL